jgi:hypothetical protein
MSKGSLLNYLQISEVPRLVEAMGGPENFINHYGYTHKEYFDLVGRPTEAMISK